MKRLLRIRLSLLLFGLAAIPLATLPFAEQIRAEWRRHWDPRAATFDRIRADLACSVGPMRPVADRGNDAGWFQYIEGEAPIAHEMTVSEDRARFEAERRLIRNEQLAQEVADAVWNNRNPATDQRVD